MNSPPDPSLQVKRGSSCFRGEEFRGEAGEILDYHPGMKFRPNVPFLNPPNCSGNA